MQGTAEERKELIRTKMKTGQFDVMLTSYELFLREKSAIRRVRCQTRLAGDPLGSIYLSRHAWPGIRGSLSRLSILSALTRCDVRTGSWMGPPQRRTALRVGPSRTRSSHVLGLALGFDP